MTMQIVSIPLNKLEVSAINVRQSGRDQGIEELAALIASQGLLNPLQVIATTKDGKPTGRYGVVAGGRRFAALRLLAARKDLPKAAPVACCIVDDARAAEISLAENSGRLAMHPADQFEAFAKLHDNGAGLSLDMVAQRFGVSTHTVRQRLRLASVSPVLMQAFRADELTLDQVMAYALTDDREAQERLFAEVPDRTAYYVRQQLTEGEVPANDRRARFVGIEAYEAAGGTVRRDLFAPDSGWMTDPLLLDRLVLAGLTSAAEAVKAEGWGWVDIVPQLPSTFYSMRRVNSVAIELSEADNDALVKLTERAEQIEAEAGDDLTDEQTDELDRIEAQADAIQAKRDVFTPDDMARSGAFVTLAHHGVQIERGMLRQDAAREHMGNVQGVQTAHTLGMGHPTEKEATGLSAAFVAEMAARRTAGLQAEVANRPHLALCVLVRALIEPGRSPCNVRVVEPSLRTACPNIDETEARKATDPEAISAHVPAEADLLPWLIEQDTETLLAMLAPLVARGIDAGLQDWTTERGADSDEAQLAQIALLEMRLWWKADAENYLNRVPKTLISDAVREGAGNEAAAGISGLKKGPMVGAAARYLDGKGWLPTMLRVPSVAEITTVAEAAE